MLHSDTSVPETENMKFTSIFIAAAFLAPAVFAAPATESTKAVVKGNPYLGGHFFANPYYATEVKAAVTKLVAAGQTALAAKAKKVETIGTAIWLDTHTKVPWVTQRLDAALKVQNTTGIPQVVTFVVYDLPDRDCAAAASNGEYTLQVGGLAKYKAYINGIAASLKAHPNNRVVLVIEPDSLANIVTNSNLAKCAEAAPVYKEGIIYAIKKFQFPHVTLYLDAGHAGWLGWPANRGPAAQLFAEILQGASPGTIRGFATNVANYNAFSAAVRDPITQGNEVWDEKTYIEAFTTELKSAGVPANFIVDTSRNGKQNLRQAWGDWCNVNNAGFGVRPTTKTGVKNVDAFVWIKPGGECDGTSNTTAPRYDYHCSLSDAKQPAPQAGTWFESYFTMLVKNANPSL